MSDPIYLMLNSRGSIGSPLSNLEKLIQADRKSVDWTAIWLECNEAMKPKIIFNKIPFEELITPIGNGNVIKGIDIYATNRVDDGSEEGCSLGRAADKEGYSLLKIILCVSLIFELGYCAYRCKMGEWITGRKV